MTPEEWEKVSEIFNAASELPETDVAQFLDRECAGIEHVRPEIESLLAANRDAGNFISKPVVPGFASGMSRKNGLSENDTVGPYRILSKLGVGGMGEVFLAEDTKLRRNVAIKTLSSVFDNDDSFLRRFRNEARAAANLNHPNVATVYMVDEHNGRPFIALEFVDGKTLDELIPENGVDLGTFFGWFVTISEALAHAHERGIFHRDIKPGNIMIGRGGKVKILDFGLACFDASSDLASDSQTDLTHAGQVLGTPSYMSPEQARGEEVDQRSDIFSLGVVMYEALTGTKPFQGDSNAEIVSNLLKTEPRSVIESRTDVPGELSTLISRCLQKRRRDRPQSMYEIRDALSGLAPATATPSFRSFSQRFYRQMPSGRVWPNLLGTAIVLAIALIGWLYFSRDVDALPPKLANLTIRRLSQSSNVVFAAITPDGKSIVFNTAEEDGNRSLWIRRIDDRNALQLVESQPVQYWGGLTVNADTSQVYYITANRAGISSTMYRISALGGPPRKLAESVNDLGSLSADGKRILFVRYLPQLRIVSANAEDGSDERVIVEEEFNNTSYRDPQFSVDGKDIYFARMERLDGVEWWQLLKIPAAGGPTTVIIPKRRERISEIAVLSDGRGLIINGADPASNLSQLFYVALPDGKLTRLTNDLNSYFGVSVDREGRAIVAAQRYDECRIWVGDAANLAESRSITPEPVVFRQAEWTPDNRIVYDALDGIPHIWIMDADGKNRQQLTSNASSDQHPRVSPDGRYIVFTSNRNGRDQIWRMNIDGSNQVLLTDVDGAATAARITPDGEMVYFYWMVGNNLKMGKVPLSGGDVTEMERLSESEWAISPDGSRIAYVIRPSASQAGKLAILRRDAPTPDMVLDLSPIYLLKWRPDGQALYIRERDAGENPYSSIIEYDLATKKKSLFLSTAPDYVIDLSFSRDGKRAAIVRGRLSTDAVLLTQAAADSNR